MDKSTKRFLDESQAIVDARLGPIPLGTSTDYHWTFTAERQRVERERKMREEVPMQLVAASPAASSGYHGAGHSGASSTSNGSAGGVLGFLLLVLAGLFVFRLAERPAAKIGELPPATENTSPTPHRAPDVTYNSNRTLVESLEKLIETVDRLQNEQTAEATSVQTAPLPDIVRTDDESPPDHQPTQPTASGRWANTPWGVSFLPDTPIKRLYAGGQQVAIYVGNQWRWVPAPFTSTPLDNGVQAAQPLPSGHWAHTPWGHAFLPDTPSERLYGGQQQVAIYVGNQWQWVPAPFSSTPLDN
jgi:hypothetical protein